MASKTVGIRLNKKTGVMIDSVRRAGGFASEKADSQIFVDALENYYLNLSKTANENFMSDMDHQILCMNEEYEGQQKHAVELFERISGILEVLSVANSTLLEDEIAYFLNIVHSGSTMYEKDSEDGISINTSQQYLKAWERVKEAVLAARFDKSIMDPVVIQEEQNVSIKTAQNMAIEAQGHLEALIDMDLDVIAKSFEEIRSLYWVDWLKRN